MCCEIKLDTICRVIGKRQKKQRKAKKFIGIYKAIENIQDIERFFPSELRKYRDSVDKELFKTAKKMYSNYDDIHGAF